MEPPQQAAFFWRQIFAAPPKELYLNMIIRTPLFEQHLLFPAEPHPELELTVIVPVKNEAEGIWSTLDALRCQVDEEGERINPNRFEILLLANNCNDQTFTVAGKYKDCYPDLQLHIAEIEIPKEHAHIGTVRRMLMDEAYNRFMKLDRPTGIIVSTDGDSEVDKNWVHYILLEMSKGNEVVGGRILPRAVSGLSRMHHLRDVSYRYHASRLESILDPSLSDPWPRHFQCYGPSLAVTCHIYEKAGRIPAIPYLEDEEFRKALCRIDAKIRKSPQVKVYTSARLCGRVDFGFSVQLQHWEAMTRDNQQQHVEPLPVLIRKMTIKKSLRFLWINREQVVTLDNSLSAISDELMIDIEWLSARFYNCNYFGELWEAIESELNSGLWRKANVLEPISDVITTFRHYFASMKSA